MKADETAKLRDALADRLRREGADDLAIKLDRCGQDMNLVCVNCGTSKKTITHCKLKWCPACQRMIAAKRSNRLKNALLKFEFPLFVTLTMANSEDPESVRILRRAFGKLRNRRLWKDTVRGGVAAIEITNIGNGWHPHLHAFVDCQWLAIKTPQPPRNLKRADKEIYYEYAKKELSMTWAGILGQDEAIVLATRAQGAKTVKEVLKYSVKGSDLIDSPDPIAPMIRMLEMTRLITTFGSLYGMGKQLDEEEEKHECQCEKCKEVKSLVPEYVLTYIMRHG